MIRLASECKTKKLRRYEDEYAQHKEESLKLEYNEDRLSLQNEISQLKKRIQKFESNEKNYEAIIQGNYLAVIASDILLITLITFQITRQSF